MGKKKRNIIIIVMIAIIGFVGYKYYEKYKTVTYEASFQFIPIKTCNYMKYNKFANLVIKYKNLPTYERYKNKIDRMKKYFKFDNSIKLRTSNPSWGSPAINFDTKVSEKDSKNDLTKFSFTEMKKLRGLSVVRVTAKIPVKGFSAYEPEYKINENRLTSSTKIWPVDNNKINDIVSNICKDDMSSREKILAILNWINENIEFRGRTTGSRYGVEQVLYQEYGHCWDYSDLFVTLSRAADIPARLVIGWVYERGGHAWTQIYLPEKGWIAVDPLHSEPGIDNNYIPFSISENGQISYILTSFPEVEKVNKLF